MEWKMMEACRSGHCDDCPGSLDEYRCACDCHRHPYLEDDESETQEY